MLLLKKVGLVLFGVIVGAVSVTYGVTAPQAVGQAQTELCTMPVTGGYSVGAFARYEGIVYRCLYVFGDDLQPDGVAWVKMDQTFSPKEPSNGR
jgi:hypothetical protein